MLATGLNLACVGWRSVGVLPHSHVAPRQRQPVRGRPHCGLDRILSRHACELVRQDCSSSRPDGLVPSCSAPWLSPDLLTGVAAIACGWNDSIAEASRSDSTRAALGSESGNARFPPLFSIDARHPMGPI